MFFSELESRYSYYSRSKMILKKEIKEHVFIIKMNFLSKRNRIPSISVFYIKNHLNLMSTHQLM